MPELTKKERVLRLLKRRGKKGLTQLELYKMLRRGEVGEGTFTTDLRTVVSKLRLRHGINISSAEEQHGESRFKRYFYVSGEFMTAQQRKAEREAAQAKPSLLKKLGWF